MAHSIITYTGDGSTIQYALNFTLGILSRDDVTCQVNNEVDGLLDPVYRDLVWINDGLVEIQGDIPEDDAPIVFTRTVSKTELVHDYENGAAIEESNLDDSNKQLIMLAHEFLDGRIEELAADLNMGGHRITNMAPGVEDDDAATVEQLNDVINDPGFQAISDDLLGPNTIGAVAAIDSEVVIVAGIDTEVVTVAGLDTEIAALGPISANITTVAGNSANVTTVATNIANVNAVGAIAANVSTVAGIAANVTSVAGNATNINTVAGDIAEVVAVGTDIADVVAVAAELADIATVAADLSGADTIGDVAAIASAVSAVAAVDSEVVVVAGIDTEVAAVAAIASDVTAVAAVAGDISQFVDELAGALRWTYDDSTAMADPGTGFIRLNHATEASVTAIAIDDATSQTGNPNLSAYVLTWDDSTSTDKGTLKLTVADNPAVFAIYTITGLTDDTGWTQLAVTYVTGAGSFTDNDDLFVTFYKTGNVGAAGSGSGDVSGPASSVDNAIARHDGTGGKTLQNYTSGAPTIGDTGISQFNNTMTVVSSGGSALGLIADNSTSTGAVFDGRDNGTSVFRINDGGNITVKNGAVGSNWSLTGGGDISLIAGGGGTLVLSYGSGDNTLSNYGAVHSYQQDYSEASTSAMNSGHVFAMTTGNTSNGHGNGIAIRGRSATAANGSRDMIRVGGMWTTATDASRSAAIIFETVNNAGSLTERMRINAAGGVEIGTTNAPAGTTVGLIVNNGTSTGNVLVLQDNGTPVVTVADGGNTTFTGTVAVPDDAYGAGWNGSANVPTKNAIYDKIQTLGGGKWVPLKTVEITSDAVVQFFNGVSGVVLDSTYKAYAFVGTGVLFSADGGRMFIRTTTNATTVDTGSSDYSYMNYGVNSDGSAAVEVLADNLHHGMDVGLSTTFGTASGEELNFTVICYNPAATKYTHFYWHCTATNSGGTIQVWNGGGARLSAADVDGVEFSTDLTDIASGYITMYGLKGA